ncbi:MAG TPA: YcxB family protein [Reyranella sp.]|nr:YcxB family protein [Reyranella sp.]
MTTRAPRAVEFSLTEDDFADLSVFVFMRQMMRWRAPVLRRIALVIFLLLAVFEVFVRWQMGRPLVSFDDDLFVVAGVAFLVALPHLPRWFARWQFRGKGLAPLRAPRRLEISAAGIATQDGIGQGLTPWRSIRELVRTETALYLFVLKAQAHIVPRHAFASAAEFEAFVTDATFFRETAGAAAGISG